MIVSARQAWPADRQVEGDRRDLSAYSLRGEREDRDHHAASARAHECLDADHGPDWQARYAFYPSIPKPVIGMLNGATAGIGLVHTLYCDLRFAADNTVFTTAFSRRGLIAEHGISWMLPRMVGHANALDLLMSARRVSSDEALRIGLVNRLYPPDQLREQTYAYARDLADMGLAERDGGDQAPALRCAVPDAGGSDDRRQPGNGGRLARQRFPRRRRELHGEAGTAVYGEVRGSL